MALQDTNPKSPLEALSRKRFEGRTTIADKTMLIGTSVVEVLPNNPNRIQWMIENQSSIDIRLGAAPSTSPISGTLLAANGGIVQMLDWEDGETVGYNVNAVTSLAGQQISVREWLRL